jgi:hypothetical protein
MQSNQVPRKDTLHLNYFKIKNVRDVRADIKIVAFNRAAELLPKEEFCCSSATD